MSKRRRPKDGKRSVAQRKRAGEFVREEMHALRRGSRHIRSTAQAVAAGLSRARAAGIRVPLPNSGSSMKNLLHPTRGPGKFEGQLQLAEKLYELTLEGGADDSMGSVDENGEAYDLFLRLTSKELGGHIGTIRAAILCEDEQGFVTGRYFDTNDEAEEAWERIAEEIGGFEYKEDDEEEED